MQTKTLTPYLQQYLKDKGKLFIPYIMAGANGLERLPQEIEELAKSGACAIELGIPFSDPVADGPVIQRAGLDALRQGVTLKKIIRLLQTMSSDIPLILMGYANSFFHYGLEQLTDDLRTTAVKGLIIPDLPYEHQELVAPFLASSDLSLIQLVTLTSSRERIAQLTTAGEGFVYAVTVNGTTGLGKTYSTSLNKHLAAIKEISSIPVLAGFGISSTEDVHRFTSVCDGVIVGSKIVSLLSSEDSQAAGRFIKQATELL